MASGLVAVILWLPATAAASPPQSLSATLQGVVRDPSDAAIVGAIISITNLDTLRSMNGQTHPDGSFRWVALPPGRYRLVVAHEGFASLAQDVVLGLDETRQVTIVLALAGQHESLDVTPPETPLVDRTKTSIGRTITSQDLDQLPVPSGAARSYGALARLAPGMVADVATTTSGMATAAQLGGSNTFLIDGVSADGPANGALSGTPPIDAVAEFKVITNHSTAEFGHASGAVVAVRSRSGSNAPAGRTYWLQQASAWNAASPAAGPAGAADAGLQQELFGGYASGPLVRNRVFLFATAEHVIRDTSYVNTSPVARLFRPEDPLTIPVHVRSPKAFVRTDAQVTSANLLTLRYNLTRATNDQAVREPGSAFERGSSLVNPIHDAAVVDTHVLGAKAVTEVRVHWNQNRFVRTVNDHCRDCATLNYPGIRLGKQPNSPLASITGRLDLAGTVTVPVAGRRGRHALKSGFNLSLRRADGNTPTNVRGTYQFLRDIPFDAGNPASYPESFRQNFGNPDLRVRDTIISVFVQDEWQLGTLATLNAGIRWDRTYWSAPRQLLDDIAPRLGLSIDPWRRGTTAFRAGWGRYYDDVALNIARDAGIAFDTLTVLKPGFQGDLVHFDPRGFNPNRTGPPVEQHSRNVFVPIATPYTDQVGIGMQHQFGRDLGLTVDLVRARGHRLPIAHDLNYRDPVTFARPDPDTSVRQLVATATIAHSWYTGLQLGVYRRLARRHSYAIAYTWSTSESDTDGARTFPQDQNDLAADRGPTLNDVRHQLVANGTLEAPFRVRITAVVAAHSGRPFNIITGTDDNRNLVSPNNDRPPGVGRNSGRGAAGFQADVRVSKTMTWHRRQIELLAEAFNVTNHANWADYNGNLLATASGAFGKPASAGPPRQIQLGARLQF